MASDPLMTALGRPNREQVVTSRPTAATTLQALELTNGETLADWLRRGVARLLDDRPASADNLVVDLYRRALGRMPTIEESRLALVVVGPCAGTGRGGGSALGDDHAAGVSTDPLGLNRCDIMNHP